MSVIIVSFLMGGTEEDWIARCEKTLQKHEGPYSPDNDDGGPPPDDSTTINY
jgi:hypothetical protein